MPRPERQDQRRRQRARAVDIGKRQTRPVLPGARQAPRERHDAERHQPQERERGRGGPDEHQRDAPVIGGE